MELALRARVQPWLERIDALELRERVLLMAAGIALMYLLLDTLWLHPALKAQQLTEQRIEDLEIKLNSLQQNARLLSYRTSTDPLQSRRETRDQLHSELAELDARIVGQLGALVEPAQAAQVLERLLSDHSGLSLINLSASTEPLGDLINETSANASELARYQVDMALKGGYLDVLKYLHSLESLPWKFFWRQVNFQLTEYPHAETRMQLYTLGAGHG